MIMSAVISAIVMLSTPSGAIEADWDAVLKSVAVVESDTNEKAIGDKGKSRGAWQMTKQAWEDVSVMRSLQGRKYFSLNSGRSII